MVNETSYDKPEESSPPKRPSTHRATVERLELARELLAAIKKGHPDAALAIDAVLTALLAAGIAHDDEHRANQVAARDVLSDAEHAVDEACELLDDVRRSGVFDTARTRPGEEHHANAQQNALFERTASLLFLARNIRGHARGLLATNGAK